MDENNLIGCRNSDLIFKSLLNWFGDRGVYFYGKNDNISTKFVDKMLECFEVLYYVDNICFWRLKSNPTSLGIYDPMDNITHNDMEENHAIVFATHDEDGNEIDVIEPWMEVPISWLRNNKDRPDIRRYCKQVLDRVKSFLKNYLNK